MARVHRLAAVAGAGTLAASVLGAPAYAVGTVINWDTGLPYTGSATATLAGGPLVVDSTLGPTNCTTAGLGGSVTSAGALTISSAAVSGCTGLASAVTPQGLNWTGTVDFTNPPNNGTITLNGFQMRATVKIGVFTVNCVYGGNISAAATNPVGAGNAKVSLAGITIPKISGALCPGSADITAGSFDLTGASGVRLGMS